MKISVVFSNVQNYSLGNLQHKLCVQCSELVREVCEEKGHCHYYTVIWLFSESHPIYNGRPSTRRTKRQPQGFPWFSDDFTMIFSSASSLSDIQYRQNCALHLCLPATVICSLFLPQSWHREGNQVMTIGMFQLGSAHVSPQNDCQWLCMITADSFFLIFSSLIGTVVGATKRKQKK